jgi:hypothetical protein
MELEAVVMAKALSTCFLMIYLSSAKKKRKEKKNPQGPVITQCMGKQVYRTSILQS